MFNVYRLLRVAYSLRQASRIVGLAPATVSALARAGVIAVSPLGAARHDDLLFTFADLTTLRAVAALPATAVRRSLRTGRSAMLRTSPGRRLRALGARLVVVEPDGRLWDAESGQWLLSFDEQSATVARVVVSAAWNQSRPADVIIDPFERALLLEAADPDAAAAAYRRLLEEEPLREDAYLNLGVLMHDAGRLREALSVYAEGLVHLPDAVMLHFNHGVALQALGAYARARQSYAAVLQRDPLFADAHHNLALCCIETGDAQAAARHANQARRLRAQS